MIYIRRQSALRSDMLAALAWNIRTHMDIMTQCPQCPDIMQISSACPKSVFHFESQAVIKFGWGQNTQGKVA